MPTATRDIVRPMTPATITDEEIDTELIAPVATTNADDDGDDGAGGDGADGDGDGGGDDDGGADA